MAELYYQTDMAALTGRNIGVIGFGNQGSAHARNLRDSGCRVRVGLRHGSENRQIAESDGFIVGSKADVAAWADVVCLLTPDQTHRNVFGNDLQSHLRPGDVVLVAHGFSVLYGQIVPPTFTDVILVAPVGPGTSLRDEYLAGRGVPAVFAVNQDVSGRADELAVAYAAALGCTRAGVIRTTFREETETDLFGEQAVLCGGLAGLVEAGFDTLVESGYQPELAYFECVHQVKYLADLLHAGGLEYMRGHISDTAEFGDYLAGPRVIDKHVREAMRDVLDDIRGKVFAERWIDDFEHGAPELHALRVRQRRRALDELGVKLRAKMRAPGPVDDRAPR